MAKNLLYPLAVVSLSFIGSVTSASSQSTIKNESVQRLVNECKREEGPSGYMYCVGFVGGVGQLMFTNGQLLGAMKDPSDKQELTLWAACTNKDVSNGAMVEAFLNWASKNHEKWNEESRQGVMLAISKTWPCPF